MGPRRFLAPYDLSISPDAFVGNLNPAQRHSSKSSRRLPPNPSVLLLDEPTSTLDFSGVEKLSGIVEQIAARARRSSMSAIGCPKSWLSPIA